MWAASGLCDRFEVIRGLEDYYRNKRNLELPSASIVKTPPQQPLPVPQLESGDRLNCYEFEWRYNAMPHVKKAELIEGVGYIAAALRFRGHGLPHGNIMGWLWTYKSNSRYRAWRIIQRCG